MKHFKRHMLLMKLALVLGFFAPLAASAQTDVDAIMMDKNNFCVGGIYSHSGWKNYWEGTLKRNNENLGTVTTQAISVNGNYGINKHLNVLFGLPYISTKASAGTLHGMKGVQDLSLWVKWQGIQKDFGKSTLSLFVLGGVSTPMSNYTPDFQPLSIGLGSTNLSARIMADYWVNNFFVTGSATYTYRDNINIDRTSYYTTELHNTNEVEMPNVASFNLRTGWRSHYLIAEAVATNMTTLGGFDIRRNDMPFPSNKMNATTVGANLKYTPRAMSGLSIIGGGNYTVAGRNMGQSTTIYGGLFYVLDFNKKHATNSAATKK
ncbi:MAG TPA: hypothetical protein PKM63_06270 [Panacibacter sp.]|nr:hypothetical protein [Panacibacter sp.]HNP43872.1 hypothetical protein [Panacibacter sp.]